jgi:phosphonate transport system substrate-binding protein
MRLLIALVCVATLGAAGCGERGAEAAQERRLMRVVLIPADGGTEDGTKADYRPVFDAVGRMQGMTFDLAVGQSYNAVVEAMCNGAAEVAFMGPVTYLQAKERGCAELLAVGVQDGQSVYYASLITAADAPYQSVTDLKGASVAFGDINSASSFVFPVAMILDAGLDPVADFGSIRLTGSHANSLAALAQGQVDVAAASLDSFEKAVGQGAVDPAKVRVLARSDAIPYPPLVMSSRLPDGMKARLRDGFARVHEAEGVAPEMIRGYGGKQVDRYDTEFPVAGFDAAAAVMTRIDDQLRSAILDKAGER